MDEHKSENCPTPLPQGDNQTPPEESAYQAPPQGGYYPPPYEQYTRSVGFFEAYKNYWKGYVNFRDRTTRTGFWAANICTYVTFIILLVLMLPLMFGASYASIYGPSPRTDLEMAWIFLIAGWGIINLLPSLALTVRRLHDIGLGWGWVLLSFIPYAGWFGWGVLGCIPTKHPYNNEFARRPQV